MKDSGVANAFSVDLEEWFQGLTSTNPQVDRWPSLESRVVEATDRLLAILRERDVRATFFVLGHVADHHPDLLRRICDLGHEIGVHGYYHRFVYRLTPDEFRAELERSVAAIERVTGAMPAGHRAPYFSINARSQWAFDHLDAMGFRYDSSVFPTRNQLYGYPDAPRFPYRIPGRKLIEMPVSTVRFGGMTLPAAGGFYARALPYAYTRWAVSQLNRARRPAILYVHPWELDLGQHYPHVTPRERITHYFGRSSLEAKLRRLLCEFRFTTMRAVLDTLEAELAPAERQVVA